MLNYSEYEQIIWSKDFESPAKTLFYENVSHRVHSLTACNVVWGQFMTMLSLSKNCNFLVGHGLVDDAEVNIFWSMQINLKQRNVPWVNFLSHLWTQDLFHKKGFTPSIYCSQGFFFRFSWGGGDTRGGTTCLRGRMTREIRQVAIFFQILQKANSVTQ